VYVPNYVPDPIEIPGNVTQEPYRARIFFIKRVAALHFGSLLLVGAVAYGPIKVPTHEAWWPMAVMILLLAALRIALRRGPKEAKASTMLLLPLLVAVGLAVQPLHTGGWPLWTVILGPGCALIYALLCGRDFSFMGQYMLSLIASSTAIAALAVAAPTSAADARFALIANTCYLTYWVYDLASLLARRRLGEELAAVVDLYRDVLNIFGYIVRCIGHWRKHRIWILPR
jgi:FtsH-binding integral membrane protein